MANLLEILPELEERHDVKIVAVTSPPIIRGSWMRKKAGKPCFRGEERQYVTTLHNGWPGFPSTHFLLPGDYPEARDRGNGEVLAIRPSPMRSTAMPVSMAEGLRKENYC